MIVGVSRFFMRKPFTTILALLLASNALYLSVNAQRDFSDVQIKTTLLSESLYMLEGAGGNIGVCVGEDGILIIDSQFAPLAPKIEAALNELQPGPVSYVLNTHLHGDHTGGNWHFGEANATIIAHDRVHERLSNQENFGAKGLPVITFSESATIHFNGEEIRLLYYGAGHTDGDTVVWFVKANVIHMGDLMFNGRFPYIDLSNGGDVEGYIAAVESALRLADSETKIIPGHGLLATRSDLELSLRMIRETYGLVKARIEEGMTLKQIQQAGMPEEWDSFDGGFIKKGRWIKTLYTDATKQSGVK